MTDMVFDLRHPIKLLGKEAASMTLREPIGEDIMAMDAHPGGGGKMLALIASCAQVPLHEVKKMHSYDIGEAKRLLEPFLTFLADPATG
jgi:hypothetical protein